MVVEVFREADGRLQGVLELADGRRDAFASTLDLLRVLEGLELTHDPATPERSGAELVREHALEAQDG
jgi:hypothetical protein